MRSAYVGLGAAFLLACGGDSSGPSAVLLAGQYNSDLFVAFSNTFEQQQGSEQGTISLSDQNGAGDFPGSYVLQDGSSGTIAGNVRADGGITLTQFGNPNVSPLTSLLFLQNAYPNCNWPTAGTTGFSGSISGTSLTLGGALALSCAYSTQSGTVHAPTTVTFHIIGTRG